MDSKWLRAALHDAYGLVVDAIEHVPAGECSVSYVVNAGTERFFVKVHTRGPGGASWDVSVLEARLSALAAMNGLPGVVVPRGSRNGRYLVATPAGPLALFPHIDGSWTDPSAVSGGDIEGAALLLTSVHAHRDTATADLLRPLGDSLDVPYAEELRRLMDAVRAPGAIREFPPAEEALARERNRILHALDALEDLATQLRRRGLRTVITHGDPNHANLLRAADNSLHLVDWDDIALGPIERDLVFFSGDRFPAYWRIYSRCSHSSPLDEETLLFYLWLWDLQEISDYGTRLLRGGLSEDQRQEAWRELRQYLPVRSQHIRRTAHTMAQASRDRFRWHPACT